MDDADVDSSFSLEEPGLLYYGILIPLTIPVAAFFYLVNWMGLKFFQHN